jgi:hypothetical protein
MRPYVKEQLKGREIYLYKYQSSRRKPPIARLKK